MIPIKTDEFEIQAIDIRKISQIAQYIQIILITRNFYIAYIYSTEKG